MLKKVTEDNPETWDRYLQALLFAYREVPQISTGFSPFELLFGHEVRGPLFLIKEKILLGNCSNEEIPVTQYVMQMREKIKEFMNLANRNELQSKKKQKTYFDRSCRKRSFKLGDKVLLLLPTSNNKLVAEWKGPFEVVRKVNKVDYVVRIDNRERMYHINMLKPFSERHVAASVREVDVAVVDEPSAPLISLSEDLTDDQQRSVLLAVEGNAEVFSSTPGQIKNLRYSIKVKDHVKPIASLPYKIPFSLKEAVKLELDKMLELGIIRKSNSPWASPVVVVTNTDKTLRLTVDYRKVNPHVNVDNYPMPDRDTVIEKLHKSKYLTKLDLTKAYFQLPLDESSRKYTSFVTEFGQFEFCVVPFGIRFASGLCNRIMKEVLSSCTDYVTNFVDDIVIHSEDFESHVMHISNVLSELRKAGNTLNRKKCKFANSSVKFLGFVVGQGMVKPDYEKVKAIRNFPRPETKKQLRSFLGVLNFYNKFVPHLASNISMLTNLLSKFSPDRIMWNKNLNSCFEDARNLVSEDAVVYIPKPSEKFILQTDASLEGIAAILGQEIDGIFRPISFISRKLTKAERNYAVIELECLAIKWSIDYFYPYLYGQNFFIRTDHAPLTWLRQTKHQNSRLTRWALSLQSMDFTIQYVKGTDNLLADALSRSPCP